MPQACLFPSLTFQGLDDLQLIRQVGEGAEGEAGGPGVLRAARVVGAGGQVAVVGREEPTGALHVPGQLVQLLLALRLEEGALRGMALLAGGQTLQRGLQVVPARGARSASQLLLASATGKQEIELGRP